MLGCSAAHRSSRAARRGVALCARMPRPRPCLTLGCVDSHARRMDPLHAVRTCCVNVRAAWTRCRRAASASR
jgi:hypothetical protein